MFTTKPIEELNKEELKQLIKEKDVTISYHALDHLSLRQRKVFKEEELIYMVKRETPRKAYLQQNGRYAAYYRKSDGYRKIIIDIQKQKAVIVSFMDTVELPQIRIK